MKLKTNYQLKLLIILACIWSCSPKKQTSYDDLTQNFSFPTDSTRIHTWWHWLEGGITKEGITKDLEAMRANGIVQATILNVGLFDDKNFGIEKVRFNTPEWYEMFAWALKEANRLNIKIGAHNCDGWSASGGPWITPEKSMKTFTWSKTRIQGGADIILQLNKPFFEENYYEDFALLAVPTDLPISKFQVANPKFTLNDSISVNGLVDGAATGGQKLKFGDKLEIELEKPFEVSKIAIMAIKPFTWSDPNNVKSSFNVFYSNDGKNFTKGAVISLAGINKLCEINIKPISAKFFKLEFELFPWDDSWFPFLISELELLNKSDKPLLNNQIPFINEKTSNTKAVHKNIFAESDKDKIEGIDPNKIVDITAYMNKDGVLNWNAPKGKWDIIRFGYTTTSAKNSPATPEGLGLECDKMDTSAVGFHFSQFSQKLINSAKDYNGNTFKFILIDSWECGFQNWTQKFPQEFEKRRGYSISKYLPILCGIKISDRQTSEAFLYDYRKTIAEVLEENYYQYFAKLCRKNNLEMHAEVIYGGGGYPALDVLKANQYSDMPMFEFWTGNNPLTGVLEYNAQKSVNFDFPASATLFYDKKILGAEAYTSMANFSETPWELKPYGDRAYCSGINQLILHSNVHQPTDSFPGMTLGPFGSHFNRHSPWFKYASSWSDYQARIQYMLQKGQMQADILYFVGEQFPQYLEPSTSTIIPQGYQIHACNDDILKNKLFLVDGKLIFGNVKFSILTLPENMGMSYETLKKIAYFVENGLIVFGSKPTNPLSLKDINTNLLAYNKLVKQLWGNIDGKNIKENQFGKGKVIWGLPLKNVLENVKIYPDFKTEEISDTTTFLYTHRVEKNRDIYFVVNQTNEELNRKLFFKTLNSNSKVMDPVNGIVHEYLAQGFDSQYVSLHSSFYPRESKIFVFEKGIKELKNTTQDLSSKSEKLDLQDFSVIVNFDTRGYSKIEPIKLQKLKSFTEFENNQIKYFSGIANYEITFSVNKSKLKSKLALLNLGHFEGTASITFNGSNLGHVWNPYSKIDVSSKIEAKNTLLVSVANSNRNRIIGDLNEYGVVKNLWTSLKVGDVFKKDSPLKESGLSTEISIELISKKDQ